ncbi:MULTISPECIES: molybdenum cofactor guanylyltransferase MobA [Methylotenera]|uniref:molybdenum cofactor guanylyltransferase MobA n=1 Tax=Methylotenera TaxID=359407 RepID=UPI00039DE3C3|nr:MULTISPECIES: molybdenum cofactor guanylyltransferase MobA [Methylotenera]
MAISSIILSGGRATRMGGVDKGLVTLQNQPLIQHVIKRLTLQVDEVLINANRETLQYQAFGFPILQDVHADFIGPLAGFSLGLQHAKHDYLLTVPCDSPLLPLDLAQRLLTHLTEKNADIAVASSDGNAHPVFCLCKKNVFPSLNQYLALGERRVSAWQKSLAYIEVDFSDNADAFINLNTLEDLAALEVKLTTYSS